MLQREETLIFGLPDLKAARTWVSFIDSKKGTPPPLRTPVEPSSPSLKSSDDGHSSTLPVLTLWLPHRHFEFWEPHSLEHVLVHGNLHLSAEEVRPRPGCYLDFSHFTLDVRTEGRQGRFSRESECSPSYVDYASTTVPSTAARRLAPSRNKSQISFSPRQSSSMDMSVRVEFTIGLPTALFASMRTRHFRITGKAVLLEWRKDQVVNREDVQVDPTIFSISYLSMTDDTLTG